MDSRQRLVNAVGRAAKQSDLLAGDNGDRAVAQAVQIAECGIVGAERLVLFREYIHDSAARSVVYANVADRFFDPLRIWRVNVKLGDAGKIGKIARIEARGSWQIGRRDQTTVHQMPILADVLAQR